MSKTESDYLRIENEFKEFQIQTSSEEMIYRRKQIQNKQLNEDKINCTLCNKNLKQFLSTKDKKVLKSHPLLNVLLCSTCFYSYLNRPVRLDIRGNVKNCAWCLGLSKLVTCINCFGRFCKKCIKRNFTDLELKEINYSKWFCYACNTRPLWDYRLINYCVQTYSAGSMGAIMLTNADYSNKLSELQYTIVNDFLNKYVISIGCLSKMMSVRIKQISNEYFTKSSLETNDNVACCFNKLTIFHSQALENFDHINKTLKNDFSNFQKEHFAQINSINKTNSDQKDDKDLKTNFQDLNETHEQNEIFNTFVGSINNDLSVPLGENLLVQSLNCISEHSLDDSSNQGTSNEINDYNDNTSKSDHIETDTCEIRKNEPNTNLGDKNINENNNIAIRSTQDNLEMNTYEIRKNEPNTNLVEDKNLNENNNINKPLSQTHFLMNLNLQTQKKDMLHNASNVNDAEFPIEVLTPSTIGLNKLNENNSGIFSQSTVELPQLYNNKTNLKSVENNSLNEIIDTLDVTKELDIINSESDEEYKKKCKLAIEQILSDSLSSSDSENEHVNNYTNGKVVNIVDMYNIECELKNKINKNDENIKQHSYDDISKLVKLSTLNKNGKRLGSENSSDDEHITDSKSKKQKKVKKLKQALSNKSTSDESDEDSYSISKKVCSVNMNASPTVLNYLDISSSDNENSHEDIEKDTKNSVENNESNDDNSSSRTKIYSFSRDNFKEDIEKNISKENNEESIDNTFIIDKNKSSWKNESLLHGNLNFTDNKSEKVDHNMQVFDMNNGSDDSIVFFENEKIDDVINRSKSVPLERKKRKSISPEIISCSDEDYKDETDDEIVEIEQSVNDSGGKGRRNIRPVISDELLLESTKKANKEEQERIKRLDDIKSNYQKIETTHSSEGCSSVKKNIVLEYSLETKKPLIEIHPKLSAVLKEHQIEGIKFMWGSCIESINKVIHDKKGTGCIVAHCMGLGKTLQVITLIHTLLSYPVTKIKRVLIIVPSNTVINWKREFNLWLTDISENVPVYTLLNNKETNQRASVLQYWFKNGGVVILSYHLLCNLLEANITNQSNVHKALFKKTLVDPGPDLVICDEGHMLKNSNTLKSRIVTKIHTGRKIMLTGTPMQNNLKEYYCMVNIVKPNLLGNYLEYNNRFVNPILNGQHRDSSEEDIKQMKKRSHVLHKILSGVIQRYEESVLHPFLPQLHHYIVFVRLSNVQNLLYKTYLNLINNNTEYKQRGNRQVLSDYNVMKNIWTHPRSILQSGKTNEKNSKKSKNTKLLEVNKEGMTLNGSDLQLQLIGIPKDWWKAVCSESDLNNLEIGTKLDILFDIIKECEAVGDKIVVFSTSLNILNTVEYFIKKESIRLKNVWQSNVDYFKIIGSTPAEIRSQYIDVFNDENNKKIKLLLASTKACGQGINMIGANRIVTLDTPWNPADDMQSLFRIYRFGQRKICYVYSLVSMNTMEQKIYERSVTKQAVACRVVDEQQINRHYIKNDIEELYNYIDLSNIERPVPKLPVDRILATMIQKHNNLIWSFHEHKKLLQNQEDEELNEEERKAAWEEFKMEEDKRFYPVPAPLVTTSFDTIVTTTLKSTVASISTNGFPQNDFPQNYQQIPLPRTVSLVKSSRVLTLPPKPQTNTSKLYHIAHAQDLYKRDINNEIVPIIQEPQIPGPSRINNIKLIASITNIVQNYQ